MSRTAPDAPIKAQRADAAKPHRADAAKPQRADAAKPQRADAAKPQRADALKPLRADARRNQERLVDTASALFDERGIEAPLEEIARRAGVGIGTLYRHFPTRDVLIEAVYRREVEKLCDGVDDLLDELAPDVALATWMRSFATYVARKRGMAMALKSFLGADTDLFTQSHQRIQGAISTLVNAAVAAGTVRSDVDPADLLRAMGGICMAADTPGWAERTERLVDLLMDGLRYGAPEPRTPDARIPEPRTATTG